MDEINKDIALEKEARSQNTSKERLKELAALNDDLAEIVASNISASSELLAELVSHKNKAVKKAVISNSNNSLETLFKLGAQHFPQELLNNPIFQLSYLENPDFIKNIPFYTLHALLQLENVPKFVLNHAQKGYQRPMVVEALQMHVAIAGEMTEGWHEAAEQKANYEAYQTHYFDFLQRWNLDFKFLSYFAEFVPEKIFEDSFFRMALAGNPKTPPEILEQLAKDKSRFMRATVARNENTPDHVLRELADYSVVETRKAVAGNKNAPLDALRKLAKDKTDSIRETVAKNEKTSIDVLKILATDKNDMIREGVAFNWNTPSNILSELATDKVFSIRKSIAFKENTDLDTLRKLAMDDNIEIRQIVAEYYAPVDTLVQLSMDKSPEVRSSVAFNLNTPADILEKLAKDEYSIVRAGLATNPNLPLVIAEKLMNDEDSEVKESFLSYFNDNPPIKILEEFATHPNEDLRKRVAYNAKIPVKISEKLATDESYLVRETVGRNQNTAIYILEQLIKDKEDTVRAAVAENENTPFYLLKQLANDKQSGVRYKVAENLNTPTEILEVLARDQEHSVCCEVVKNPQCALEIKETVFKNLAQRETPSFLRYVLFLSDYAESSVLAENSNSISWLERYAIAQNKKTPKATLQQLAQDGNRIVRATAKESLQKYY